VDAAEAGGADEVVVVVGAHAAAIEAALRLPPNGRVARNPDHAAGQSTSLRVGILAVAGRADAVVVVLADQPGVTGAEVRAVLDAHRAGAAPIVRAAYRGTPGHPVLIDRSLFDEVLAQEGDAGARDVLSRRSEEVVEVPVDREPPRDVDTPADLDAVRGDVSDPGNAG
jgi:CTP:molybdopterin cytidylyltransferase MocA